LPTLTLWFRMVGVEPTNWVETIPTRSGTTLMLPTVPPPKSVTGGSGLFRQQLAERVWIPFSATLKHQKAFDAVVCSSEVISAATIGSTDLLCYVCDTRAHSILRRNDIQRFNNFITKNPNAGGCTTNVITPMGETILSEIWLDQMKSDMGVAWRAVYHEFMHNKTRWAHGEDTDWVHTHGGGGVAAETGPSNFADVNPSNQMKMAGRLTIRNSQFWQTFP
jgi:hypothetical protein